MAKMVACALVGSRLDYANSVLFGASAREHVFFVIFSDFKKHDFLRFFEMTYQKIVKSHQQKFSPQYVTKE